MFAALMRIAPAIAAATLALAAAAGCSQTPPGTAAAAAQAPASSPLIGEGPGGRTALGSWTLALDRSDRGVAKGWRRGGFAGRTVSVPNVVDGTDVKGAAGWRNYNGTVVWYRTTFNAPRAGTYALTFASANFRASVFVDGHAVGTHIGSYLPFEARAVLAEGVHTVVVRVDWRNPNAQVSQGFHRNWFNWGGIDGAVSVRAIGMSELSEPSLDVRLQPDSPDASRASVRIAVRVTNHGPARTLAPRGALTREGTSVPIEFQPREFAHGEAATLATTVTVAHPALWAPGHPSLYELQLSEGTESNFSARVGLRELSWGGGRLYLNGVRLLLHGASLMEDAHGHGDALSSSDDERFVSELEAIGANCVRSQHPLDPALVERLDAAGILVWQGIGPVEAAGNWHETTPALVRAARAQAITSVHELALHPSIFAWNIADEIAENGHSAPELSYVRSLAAWLHRNDPTRIVALEAWGDHPPTAAGAIYSGADAVAETDYTGWYDDARASSSRQRALIRVRLAAMERTFAGKVLVISEFGAEANSLNPPGAPGSYSFQARLLERHISVYEHDRKLTGMLIWNLRDFPLIPAFLGGSILARLPGVHLVEGMLEKGLFTYAGAAKPAMSAVARLFKALPSE